MESDDYATDARKGNDRVRFQRFPSICDQTDLIPINIPGKWCPKQIKESARDIIDEMFENHHVYVISLERRSIKRHEAMRELKKHNLSGYIFNAVDGNGITSRRMLRMKGICPFPGYVGHTLHNISLTTGEIGCFCSHYSLWLHMHKNEIPCAIILEDDFHILDSKKFLRQNDTFRERLRSLLRSTRSLNVYNQSEAEQRNRTLPFDLLYLSRYPVSSDFRYFPDIGLSIPGFSYWTIGYVLTLAGARKLLNAKGLENMLGLDDWISLLAVEPIDSRSCAPKTQRYRSHLHKNLYRLACVPPLLMPREGAFWLSDTVFKRGAGRFEHELPEND